MEKILGGDLWLNLRLTAEDTYITNRFFGISLVSNLCLNFVLNLSIAVARARGFIFLGMVPTGDFFGRNTLVSLEIPNECRNGTLVTVCTCKVDI